MYALISYKLTIMRCSSDVFDMQYVPLYDEYSTPQNIRRDTTRSEPDKSCFMLPTHAAMPNFNPRTPWVYSEASPCHNQEEGDKRRA
jgi:hypothetical protein